MNSRGGSSRHEYRINSRCDWGFGEVQSFNPLFLGIKRGMFQMLCFSKI
jgi:hypothetical protein